MSRCMVRAAAAVAGDDVARFVRLWSRLDRPSCTCGECTWPTIRGDRVRATRAAIESDLREREDGSHT